MPCQKGGCTTQEYSNETGVNHLYYDAAPGNGSIDAGMERAAPKKVSLSSFIAADCASFADYIASDGPDFATADGQVFKSQMLNPRTEGDIYEIAVDGRERNAQAV